MNNIKKTVLGMFIGLVAFGISAYTTIKDGTIVRYYKTDATYPAVNDPRGYTYYSGERCQEGGSVCSAEWNIGTNTAPADGDGLPLTGITFEGGIIAGHFE